jgi:hypothetical protein
MARSYVAAPRGSPVATQAYSLMAAMMMLAITQTTMIACIQIQSSCTPPP